MRDILIFDVNAKLLPFVSDEEKAIYPERYEAIYDAFINVESAATVSYSVVIRWEQDLEILKFGFVALLMKNEIESLGAKLNGIQLSIEDKKAIVNVQIPITLTIAVIVKTINNLASKII
jgi:hypothetical protein